MFPQFGVDGALAARARVSQTERARELAHQLAIAEEVATPWCNMATCAMRPPVQYGHICNIAT